MDYVTILAAIAITQFLAAASPGPTFLVVTSHAIGVSRRAGLQVAVGVLLATLTWCFSAAFGVAIVIGRIPWLYTSLQLVGAIYLMYLGGRMVVSAARQSGSVRTDEQVPAVGSGLLAVRAGFLANMTNPKSIAYYASLFVVMIPANAPASLFWAAVVLAVLVSALWWCAVALLFSTQAITRAYKGVRRQIDLIVGGTLILLGCRLAFAR